LATRLADHPAPGPRSAQRRAPAELRFVFAVARMAAGGGGPQELSTAAGQVADWEVALRGLTQHGLTGLAAPILQRERVMPPEVQPVLLAHENAHQIAVLMRIREAIRIIRALEAQQIRYLVIKGVPLSIQIHGDPASRGGRDIDIWVEPGRMTEAEAILAELGYVPPIHAIRGAPTDAATPKESGWVHAETRILVELHDRLTENRALLPWDFDALWETRETVLIGGQPVPTMARGRLPVYLAVHGAKHGWQRLMWLADMAALLEGRESFEGALADARVHGLEGMMLHVFWVLRHWLGVPVPDDLLARASRRIDTRLLNVLAARFHGGRGWYQDAPRNSMARLLAGSLWARAITWLMRPSARYWGQQIAWELDSPADRAFFALPPGAAWMYPMLRPFGWAIRRLRR